MPGMKRTIDEIRAQALDLSASERASLAHELILSLDDPEALELSAEQEAEIRRRVQSVRDGKAAGRDAEDVLADIKARCRK
jgi:putative addiction module component (TIGR02574 family)